MTNDERRLENWDIKNHTDMPFQTKLETCSQTWFLLDYETDL